eukprot:CAMPEP_0117443970 /NCGR_PEP_ID=MMETSP0759-20121206/4986_1 /TAXON_ID=63605 /ORGANISM="Percolomonas cosmopolitus, Strain WS" /LENGTH=398 /DNA_ID=CAMNT_0005235995 /DNA_START=269 /DNA_END=1465 /DNA_ORIENTATION=-
MTGRQKSLILSILSQLRFGADMTKILIPVDFLEARSLTEKVTDFWTHGYLITDACKLESPMERMIGIVKWYLSCWHIGPQGVKKPYNPILGETYRCNFEMPDKSITTFLAEQVSHHPPITAIKAENKSHDVLIGGWYYPRTKFLGNSAGSCAEGLMKMTFVKHDEVYEASWPDFFARGIIFGKVTMEICGKTFIKCEKTGLRAEFDFKAKPFFGGEYNVVEARILRGDEELYTISGKWTEGYTIKKRGEKTGVPFFDCDTAFRLDKNVIPRKHLLPFESHVVWRYLTKAIRDGNVEGAADEKENVEKEQRLIQKRRDQENIVYQPRYFKRNDKENYWDFVGDHSSVYKCLLHPIGSEAYEKERQKIDAKPFFEVHPEENDPQLGGGDDSAHPSDEDMD